MGNDMLSLFAKRNSSLAEARLAKLVANPVYQRPVPQSVALPAPPPPPPPEPVAEWQGENTDFLATMVQAPENAQDSLPQVAPLQVRIDLAREAEQKYVVEINDKLTKQGLTNCDVRPWAMIPYACWQGEHAQFLINTLELIPMGPWNNLLLPIDPRGAVILSMKPHPMEADPAHAGLADQMIASVAAALSAEQAKLVVAVQTGDPSAAAGLAQALTAARARLVSLAPALAAQVLGEPTVRRSIGMFRASGP